MHVQVHRALEDACDAVGHHAAAANACRP
jgi:hypothetical protein